MTIEIRRAHQGDEDRLGLIAAATFGFACPPDQSAEGVRQFITTVLSPERFADYLADPSRELILAEADGVPLGYAMLVYGEPSDEGVRAVVHPDVRCELSKFYVFSGHHGRGLASKLMDRTLESAAEHGVTGVWLGVNIHNARANRFYEKHGFEIVGSKNFLLGGRLEDDHVRERRLDTARR